MKRGAQSRGLRSRFDRLRLLALSIPILVLGALHAALLLRRISEASITSPAVLGRWAFALALLIAGLVIQRLPARRRGRRVVVVFWLLVAMLHLALPTGGAFLDARDEVALLVEAGFAAAPVLIILAALLHASGSMAPWQSRRLAIDLPSFAPFRSRSFHGDRAPPLS